MNKLLIILTVWLLGACGEKTQETKTEKTEVRKSNDELLQNYCSRFGKKTVNFSQIIIINEIGTCIKCNIAFSRAQSSNLKSDSTLFIVSASGAMVDISDYVDISQKNLIYDPQRSFDKLNIVSAAAIIGLKEGKITRIENVSFKNSNELSSRSFVHPSLSK